VKCARIAAVTLAIAYMPQCAWAQPLREAGVRYYQHWAGDGTRVGDMQGWGGFVFFPIGSDWAIGGGFDRLYYDMETPIDAIGIPSADPEPVDSFTNVYRIRADARRYFRRSRGVEPYLEAGFAVFIGNADDAQGVTAEGGTYQLTVDTPATPAWNFSAGLNIRVVEHFLINVAVSYGRAFREYHVTDTVSGRSGDIAPLSPLGPSIALVYRF
jgi:hypothetical protein